MLIVADPHSGVPVYRQLMDQIEFHRGRGVSLHPDLDLEPGIYRGVEALGRRRDHG